MSLSMCGFLPNTSVIQLEQSFGCVIVCVCVCVAGQLERSYFRYCEMLVRLALMIDYCDERVCEVYLICAGTGLENTA